MCMVCTPIRLRSPKTRLAERNDLNAIGNIAYSDLPTVAIIDLRVSSQFQALREPSAVGPTQQTFLVVSGLDCL